ncbi:MFS transporter [Bacillus velezensis]|uniref:MFS transporter n=1 Tax=Bacillus velezensis TaxID=492670 RepID=UPI00201C60FF|nr:MFS transporter [Bacillus velezensis]
MRFLIGMGLGGEAACRLDARVRSVRSLKSGDGSSCCLRAFGQAGWLLAAVISYFVIPAFGWQAAAALNGAGRVLCAVLCGESLPESPAHQALIAEKKYTRQAGSVWTKPYIRPTVLLSVVWFCVVFSYYGMFLWLPSVMLMKGLQHD